MDVEMGWGGVWGIAGECMGTVLSYGEKMGR